MPDDISEMRGICAKPWTIRNVPPDVRNAALAAAKRRGMDIGELVSRALLSDIQAERQEQRAPAVVQVPAAEPATSPAVVAPALDLAGLAQLLGALGEIPDGLRRDTVRATRAILRQARGLPPVRRGRVVRDALPPP